MSGCGDARIHAQRHAQRTRRAGCRAFEPVEFAERIGVHRVDTFVRGPARFFVGAPVAVQHAALRREAGGARQFQLAERDRIGAEPGRERALEQRGQRIRFQRERHERIEPRERAKETARARLERIEVVDPERVRLRFEAAE